jgi:hypothetical protein
VCRYVLGLLTMGPVHMDEKYRDNYVTVVRRSALWRL